MPPTTNLPDIDPEALRVLMRAWASGVTIVTTAHNGQRHGMTVSSFTSVSLEPPNIVVCIAKDTRTYPLLQAAGTFAVNILRADQIPLSNRFAGRDTQDTDRFAGFDTHTAVTGAPILSGSLAWMDCRVVGELDSSKTMAILGRVLAGDSTEGAPLLYWNRNYRQFTGV